MEGYLIFSNFHLKSYGIAKINLHIPTNNRLCALFTHIV